jgi:hypothetical protein
MEAGQINVELKKEKKGEAVMLTWNVFVIAVCEG